jgi:hypothetical protein
MLRIYDFEFLNLIFASITHCQFFLYCFYLRSKALRNYVLLRLVLFRIVLLRVVFLRLLLLRVVLLLVVMLRVVLLSAVEQDQRMTMKKLQYIPKVLSIKKKHFSS